MTVLGVIVRKFGVNYGLYECVTGREIARRREGILCFTRIECVGRIP